MTPADWYQQALTPPEVLELRIRLGLIPDTDHAQVLVELYDPMSGVLVAQASKPSERLPHWPALLEWATSKANEYLESALEPF